MNLSFEQLDQVMNLFHCKFFSYDVLFNSLVQQTIKFNHQIRNDCASCAVFFVYESKADALISVAPSVF